MESVQVDSIQNREIPAIYIVLKFERTVDCYFFVKTTLLTCLLRFRNIFTLLTLPARQLYKFKDSFYSVCFLRLQ